ncbi:MAG: gliding motility-associated C-terminal domain-containing protein [Rhizobacter sp.]|nr:gliding motility-associated C-terminal domain-containing protein [Ferruginibacter sp.]
MNRLILLIFLSCLSGLNAFAQPCSVPGMIPSSAIPVCGTTPFVQDTIALCSGPSVATTGCAPTVVTSSRSFWYKFTCYQTGSFAFEISAASPAVDDDYDWVLYDITGRNPGDVFTNSSLQVSMNIYGVSGPGAPFPNLPTGCRAGASGDVHCAGSASGNTPFNRMPTLTVGHEYLLMVANFTNSTNGYQLSFTGGTASITDPLLPRLSRAASVCDTRQVRVKLNKKMKCNSLAPDGSDFTINDPGNSIISAAGIGCANGFDMDSVILTLTNPIPPGNYVLTARRGTDNNTLLDYCDRSVPAGDNVPFIIAPVLPTPMDSLTRPGCAPNSLQLVFRKSIQCSSIAPNGSDFAVTGPTPVVITAATGNCTSGLSRDITLQLSGPMQVGGVYTITLQNGSDGNTLTDECSLQTPAGSFINFSIADTVNANFTYNIVYGCAQNTVQYNHNGTNGINSWQWNFDGTRTSSVQNPLITYTDFRQKNTTLIVSNGVCKDTATAAILFDNLLVAAFEGPPFVCPNETATFLNQSEGNITGYEWTFGNGVINGLRNPPPQTYPVPLTTRDQTVRLIIRNSFGCSDTATHTIKVVNNCYIAVPSAFTPNNDGLNDYLYPLNAYKARELTFSVYNRFGQRLFFTRNWLQKWDGTFKGQGADSGTYVWVLQYIHVDTNQKTEQKGTVILIR